jgi:hypothetical protein
VRVHIHVEYLLAKFDLPWTVKCGDIATTRARGLSGQQPEFPFHQPNPKTQPFATAIFSCCRHSYAAIAGMDLEETLEYPAVVLARL